MDQATIEGLMMGIGFIVYFYLPWIALIALAAIWFWNRSISLWWLLLSTIVGTSVLAILINVIILVKPPVPVGWTMAAILVVLICALTAWRAVRLMPSARGWAVVTLSVIWFWAVGPWAYSFWFLVFYPLHVPS